MVQFGVFYACRLAFLVRGIPVVEGRSKKMHRCALVAKAVESRTHVVGECKTYKEERDVLEMRKIDECGMKKFGTLDSSEKNDRYPRR